VTFAQAMKASAGRLEPALLKQELPGGWGLSSERREGPFRIIARAGGRSAIPACRRSRRRAKALGANEHDSHHDYGV